MNPGEVWKDESGFFYLIGPDGCYRNIAFCEPRNTIEFIDKTSRWLDCFGSYPIDDVFTKATVYAYATFQEFFDVKFEEARKEFSTRWRTLCKRVDAIREEHGLVVGAQKGEGNG